MDLLIIVNVLIVFLLIIPAQKWYASYLREKKEEEEYKKYYVMNLEERKEHDLNNQGFISFVRFLFLLSILGTFLKEVFERWRLKFLLMKKLAINSTLYKVIKKY
jgi:uncharacterized membrane protein